VSAVREAGAPAAEPVPLAERLLERGLVPDALVRVAIRRLLAERLAGEEQGSAPANARRQAALVAELRRSPIAIHTAEANRQHYELPAGFFEQVLGPRLKYSCALYALPGAAAEGGRTLAEAEEAMLALTATRARLADGERILELGCGWGSLTLYLAERLPRAKITAVSNSHGQRRFIEARAGALGLRNVEVVTADINALAFADGRRFDRVVSVEMFEHLRNYEQLFERIALWLEPGGTLFAHVFCHRAFAYPFEVQGAGDWMARHFFTGGLMPSAALFAEFQEHLRLRERWSIDGRHYQRTAEDWLRNFDAQGAAIEPLLTATYGAAGLRRWRARWRVFFMACAELFGYAGGREWQVGHYLLEKPRG